MKNFTKSARELMLGIQKIDANNYPEVTLLVFLIQQIEARLESVLSAV
jgi:hypothetical protein